MARSEQCRHVCARDVFVVLVVKPVGTKSAPTLYHTYALGQQRYALNLRIQVHAFVYTQAHG